MVSLRPILSTLLVAAYLSAAFVPCEPALVFADWTSGAQPHGAGMPGAAPSANASPASAARSIGGMHAHQSAPHGSHHPAVHAAQHPRVRSDSTAHQHDVASSHHAAVDPSNGPIAAQKTGSATRRHHATHARGELLLKPTCLCGCSESRATVGGSVSRLGAAVPAVQVGRLVELRPPAVLDLESPRAPARPPEHDPIPI